MTISFNEIPNNRLVPFVYVEFDNTRAAQGPSIQPYKVALIGQKLSGGTATAEEIKQITNITQAQNAFGRGSQLAKMFESWFDNNNSTEVVGIPLDDDGAAVKASGSFDFAGSATESGIVYAYIDGKLKQVGVSSGDSASTIATAVAAAINADADLPVVAGTNAGTVNIEAKNGGEAGNELDARLNYNDNEELPAGVTVTVNAFASGAGNPDIDLAIAAVGETQYNIIAHPYADANNLTKIESELSDRFGPLTQNDGVSIIAKKGSFATLSTLGDSRNSQHSVIVAATGIPQSSSRVAAAIAALVSFHGQIDPARPFQNLAIDGINVPVEADRFTDNEKNLLLLDSIATLKSGSGGQLLVQRLVTTYQTNAAGALDISYRDLNTLLTLSYLRFDFRNTILLKYPRHKLADDDTQYDEGQAVVTPKTIRGEAISKFRQWESAALVEGIDQFKNDLIVERSATDPNRLDVLLPPDLVNQFRVLAAQIQFLL